MFKEVNTKRTFTRIGHLFVIVSVCIASVYINQSGYNVSAVIGLYLTVAFLMFPAKFITLVRVLNESTYLKAF